MLKKRKTKMPRASAHLLRCWLPSRKNHDDPQRTRRKEGAAKRWPMKMSAKAS